jgi:hypothetical protein
LFLKRKEDKSKKCKGFSELFELVSASFVNQKRAKPIGTEKETKCKGYFGLLL